MHAVNEEHPQEQPVQEVRNWHKLQLAALPTTEVQTVHSLAQPKSNNRLLLNIRQVLPVTLALQCKNEGVPVSVYLSASEEPYNQQLQAAADAYQQKTGKRLAVLLITNPDNPTGTVYTRQHLLQMLKWCVQSKVHLIR